MGENARLNIGYTRVLSGTTTLRFIRSWRLRFSCVCVLKTLRFIMLRLRALKERGQCDSGNCVPNAAYLAAICDLNLRFRATTGARGAIWEIA